MTIQTILSPVEAKAARHAAQLSQAKVSAQTGISRTKLALFEVEKYLLEPEALTQLRDFYDEIGVLDQVDSKNAAIPDQKTHTKPCCALLDGFAIPSGLDEGVTETLLADVARNDAQIKQLAAREDGKDLWVFEADHSDRDEIIRLMALNYRLSRRLQGREILGANLVDGSNAASVAEVISS